MADFDFSTLSIKQLNHLLNAKCLDLSEEDASRVKQQQSTIVEKAALIALCVDNVPLSEVDALLKICIDKQQAPQQQASNSKESSKPAAKPAVNAAAEEKTFDASEYRRQVASQMNSPDQLRYSAACMRRDPNAFRRSNPEASSFSDAQIMTMAAQMEQMAADPEKMRLYREQVSKMSDDEIQRMRKMQQHTPPPDISSTASNIERFISALQRDPKDARTMLKTIPGLIFVTCNYCYIKIYVLFHLGMTTVSDETLDKQLEQLRQLDPAMLRKILSASESLKVYYDRLDAFLGGKGRARILLLILLILTVLFLGYMMWRIFAFLFYFFAGSESKVSNQASGLIDVIDTTSETASLKFDEQAEFEF